MDIKRVRDQLEREKLTNFKRNMWPLIQLRDELFGQFCAQMKRWRHEKQPKLDKYALAQIEELWGLWLNEIEVKIDDVEEEMENSNGNLSEQMQRKQITRYY